MTIPKPQVGSVIRFSYLWRQEADQGKDDGSKDRPAAIVTSYVSAKTGKQKVIVLPITRSEPQDPNVAVEIPPRTQRALGLEPERCWIICNQANRFTWPGHDIRPVPVGQKHGWIYGVLPRGLFLEVVNRFSVIARRGRIKSVERD